MSGLFIAFEGGEGSGKSTQVKLLAQKMREAGHDVLETKEPGSPLSAACIKVREIILDPNREKMDALTEFLLYYFDRVIHLKSVVAPALEKGKNVLTDRFADSTKAYQVVAGGVDASDHELIHAAAVDREPDYVILLDIDPLTGLGRKKSQDEINRMELKGLEFHQKVNQAFRDFAYGDSKRWLVFDATDPIETLSEKIWAEVQPKLSS